MDIPFDVFRVTNLDAERKQHRKKAKKQAKKQAKPCPTPTSNRASS